MINKRLFFAILFSLLAHLLLAGVLLWYPQYSPKNLSPKIIKISLSKGIKKPVDLLPRKPEIISIEKKAQQEQKPESKSLEKKVFKPSKLAEKTIPIASTKKNSVKNSFKQSNPAKKSITEALNSLAKKWGDPDAKESKLSKEITGEINDDYLLRVQEMIQEAYELPATMSEHDRQNLEVNVKIYINYQGQLVDIKVIKSSGNKMFDNIVTSGARSISSFDEPPLLQRQQFLREGVIARFCPLECKS